MLPVHCSPALNQTALPIFTSEYFPLARIRGALVHEIESEDYSRLVTGDYFQKPLSNWTGLSPGIQLYGT